MTVKTTAAVSPLTPKQQPTWLRSPQRVWLRRSIFQVHLWVGIAIALYAIVIGLSGSAIVFREEIERATWPGIFHIAPSPQQITLQETIQHIQTARPHWTAFALRDFSDRQQAFTVLMRHDSSPLSPNYRQVSFNPYSGEVLLDRLRYAGWLGWLGNLHVYLLAGQTGLKVSGAMAIGLLILCLTGLVLWWPGIARWTAALKLNPNAKWKRLNWDLHSVVGFWTCTALLVVTFTGIDFAFPDQVGNIVELVCGGSLTASDNQPSDQQHNATTDIAPIVTIDQAVAAARKALPPDAPPGYMSLPSSAKTPIHVTGYVIGSLPYSELVRVSIDPRTGAVLSYADTRKQSLGTRVEQHFTTVHFGSFGGPGISGIVVKIFWVLLGIVPALLAVTGLIMYWNRYLRQLWTRLRRAKSS